MHFDALNLEHSEEQTEVCKHFPCETKPCRRQAQSLI